MQSFHFPLGVVKRPSHAASLQWIEWRHRLQNYNSYLLLYSRAAQLNAVIKRIIEGDTRATIEADTIHERANQHYLRAQGLRLASLAHYIDHRFPVDQALYLVRFDGITPRLKGFSNQGMRCCMIC